jgi:hypothetical protein
MRHSNHINTWKICVMAQHVIIYKQAKADIAPVSTGQAGPVSTNAIAIAIAIDPSGHDIRIKAITLGSLPAQCFVGLPKNPGLLRELAALLLMTVEEIQSRMLAVLSFLSGLSKE